MDELNKAMQDVELAFDLFRAVDGAEFCTLYINVHGEREIHVFRGIENLAEIFGEEIDEEINSIGEYEKYFNVDGWRFFELVKSDE